MTLKAYNLPPDLDQDIKAYAGEVNRFLAGAMLPAVFKAKRVPRGIYEQRKDGSYMVRVRVAGGVLNSSQIRHIAGLARRFGNSQLHVTTRQDIQFHDIKINDTPVIMRELKEAGLTTKGGGGNTVRNITACPYAGVCPHEQFDVSQFVQETTGFLIPLTGSYNLPRKYKIAFSGCSADCALARISDLGFIAEIRDSKPGFAVFAGGGMGANSRIADRLEEWIPATDTIRISEAVRRLFDRLGDRQNRHRARLRFVLEKIGVDNFRNDFRAEIPKLKDEGVPDSTVSSLISEPNVTVSSDVRAHMQKIAGLRCMLQRQKGYAAVIISLPLGLVSTRDLEIIADIAEDFSLEKGLRTTRSQNLLIRFVPVDSLEELADSLKKLSITVTDSPPISRFVSCAGASTCRLGLCLSRNAAKACAGALAKTGIDKDLMSDFKVNVSGCPNSCGQHPMATIGLFGSAQRFDGRLVPVYQVLLGARHDEHKTRLGEAVGAVPAYSLPSFLVDLMKDFNIGHRNGESFVSYVERIGFDHFKNLVEHRSHIPIYDENPAYYRDLGQNEEFSLAGRGAGECGAGVFEVIREDIATAKKALNTPATEKKQDTLFNALLATVRALLITRGIDTRDSDTILREFEKHFIDTALVSADYRSILSKAHGYLQGWATALNGTESEIAGLLDRIELLFSTLDANLIFHSPEANEKKEIVPVVTQKPAAVSPDQQIDLTGVACPMNFVKAKLRLEMMETGSILSIVLDDGEPIQNVPASLKSEGHEIIETTALNAKSWSVVVRKK